MEWSDQGIVLSVRPHGESNAILELLTPRHGRHLGLVRGGRSRHRRPVLQPGNRVEATWRARLPEHLGSYSVELLDARAARVLDDVAALAGLSTLCALARLLPEREPHGPLHEAAELVLSHIGDRDIWPGLLVRWELELLNELGFGLDLASCAATGGTQDLVHVSPKSGRAVSAAAGAPYATRLLALPGFLAGRGAAAPTDADIRAGFALTGHFLHKHVFVPRGLRPPEARERLVGILGKRPTR